MLTIDVRMMYHSGIGTYIRNVVPTVIELLPNLPVGLIGDPRHITAELPLDFGKISIIPCTTPIYSIAEQIVLPRIIPKSNRLYWTPHYPVPLFHEGKILITIHDLFHLAVPKLAGGLHKRLYARLMFSQAVRKAERIICPSKFTQTELCRRFSQQKEKILVVPNGIDQQFFFPDSVNNSPHNRPYFLYVGNIKPHKNLKVLLQAFGHIAQSSDCDLILVGKRSGFITGDRSVADYEKILGTRLIMTGEVTNDLLRQYLRHATGLVFPSLYEGFGLPVLEAMACNTPVIASDIPVLHEVARDAAMFFNPNDSVQLAQLLNELLNDSKLREEYRLKGEMRARDFSWRKSARMTAELVKEIYF